MLWLIVSVVFFYLVMFYLVILSVDCFWLIYVVIEVLECIEGCIDFQVVIVGYREFSVVFVFGMLMYFGNGNLVVMFFGLYVECGVVLVVEESVDEFENIVVQVDFQVEVFDLVEGYNYVKGDLLWLMIYLCIDGNLLVV